MHPYATDSNERNLAPFIFAIVSVFFAWLLNRVLEVQQFPLPWWINAPSVIGFYGILYSIFAKCLWKCSFFRRIGFVKLPNLNGTWNGHITSSFDEHAKEQYATLDIRQSWAKISISLRTQNSKSLSLTASILTENQNFVVISYEYISEPMPNSSNTMHMHRGTARLTLISEDQSLEGEYYSGRGRLNLGVLSFKRQ